MIVYKRKIIGLGFIILAVILLIQSFLTRELIADNVFDVTISPPKFEENISPGDEISRTIKVINNSQKKLYLEVEIYDFKPYGEEGRQTFISPESGDPYINYSLSEWVNISSKSLSVGPQQTKEYNFSIRVPESAEPGGHYAVIFFKPVQVEETDNEKISDSKKELSIKGNVGTLLLVKVEGEVNELAKIVEFSSPKKIYNKTPITFVTRLFNFGNCHIKPKGFIDIYNIFNKKIDTLEINKEEGNVLPVSIRKFEEIWESNRAFGRYKAHLSLVYGEKNKVLTADTVFWVVPWWILLICFLGFMFVVGFILWIIKRRKKHRRKT